jgi:glycosyltransferase involved in cell wall biosynthesis
MLDRGEVTEVIVVDDCSTDACAAIVEKYPIVRRERTAQQSGPAAARNHAAGLASGHYLWFVDSDVVVRDDCARVLSRVFAETQAGAVFGCYDDSPSAAGCGAIERNLFVELRGFAAERYPHPSVEDIELGYRIVDLGRHIVLRRDLEAKHLKEWRLKQLLHTEIFRRAIPWSRLMLERKHMSVDLNVAPGERLRALLAMGTVATLLAWVAGWASPWLPAAALAGAGLANLRLIRYFKAQRGLFFASRAFLYHQLYYIYSSAAFAYASLQHLFRQLEERKSTRRVMRNRGA